MKFHVITGTPRSGSTLLANILRQNPQIHASDTSALGNVVNVVCDAQSRSDEVTSDLVNDRERTEQRAIRVFRSIVEAWYTDIEKPVIFDKGRMWTYHNLELLDAFPHSKTIIMVRDQRDIFASIEKQHRKNPMFFHADNLVQKTVFNKASTMLAADGFIGQPTVGVENAIRRDSKNQIMVQYEAFVEDPELVIRRIYKFIDEELFDHDYENVEDQSKDLDALWLNKFPHQGSGKVMLSPTHWQEYVDQDTAENIMQAYPFYNRTFGYQ